LLEEARRRDISIDEYARAHPVVLHAPRGAALAREDFGVSDPQVLSAVEKHTLGAPQMSALDCVLYLADGLEPERDFAERAELCELAHQDLDAAMRATIRSTIQYLREKNLSPAPQTAAVGRAFGLEPDELEVPTA